jgi:20S proteasome subunit beta 2
LIVSEDVKLTTGAGKDQVEVEDKPVAVGAGPGGEEGMDLDA